MPSSHRVISKRTFLFKNKMLSQVVLNYLPLGSQVSVKEIDKKWAKVQMFENCIHKYAYVPSNHLIKIGKTINDWVSMLKN